MPGSYEYGFLFSGSTNLLHFWTDDLLLASQEELYSMFFDFDETMLIIELFLFVLRVQ